MSLLLWILCLISRLNPQEYWPNKEELSYGCPGNGKERMDIGNSERGNTSSREECTYHFQSVYYN